MKQWQSVLEQYHEVASLLILFILHSMTTFCNGGGKAIYLPRLLAFSTQSPRMLSLINPFAKRCCYNTVTREICNK